MPYPALVENEALQVHLASRPSQAASRTKAGSWSIGLLEARSARARPGASWRRTLLLERDEPADVAHDAVEEILAAHPARTRPGRRHRGTRAARRDRCRSAPGSADGLHQGAVGVEQDVGAAILEGSGPSAAGPSTSIGSPTPWSTTRATSGTWSTIRVNSVPAHVGRGFQGLEGARAGLAQQVAAVRDLQIQADRRRQGLREARSAADRLEVAARIGFKPAAGPGTADGSAEHGVGDCHGHQGSPRGAASVAGLPQRVRGMA